MVCISQAQRNLHLGTEIAALAVAAPFSFYVATRESLPTWARATAFLLGVGTVVVDGYLAARYLGLGLGRRRKR